MIRKYPLHLSYTPSSSIWGGHDLETLYGKAAPGLDNIAETWELSVRDEFMSRIQNGGLAGMTLLDYISEFGRDVVSDRYDGKHFPLLIKFIDAAEDLSIQVHPDDSFAGAHENDSGKNEMWYIISAKEDSEIIRGFNKGYCADDLDGLGTNREILRHIKVRAGESYYIPAGTPHAIGKGILLAEIQQNSDLTYRIYDYDRLGKDGKPRELHIDKAKKVAKNYSDEEIYSLKFENGKNRPDCIANNGYFCVVNVKVDGRSDFTVGKEGFHALLSLDGDVDIIYGDKTYAMNPGECRFIPAGSGKYSLCGKGDLLISSVAEIK